MPLRAEHARRVLETSPYTHAHTHTLRTLYTYRYTNLYIKRYKTQHSAFLQPRCAASASFKYCVRVCVYVPRFCRGRARWFVSPRLHAAAQRQPPPPHPHPPAPSTQYVSSCVRMQARLFCELAKLPHMRCIPGFPRQRSQQTHACTHACTHVTLSQCTVNTSPPSTATT